MSAAKPKTQPKAKAAPPKSAAKVSSVKKVLKKIQVVQDLLKK